MTSIANIYAYATQFSRQQMAGKRNPQINLSNMKPYRTAAMKLEAQRKAYRAADGSIQSAAPFLFHRAFRASVEQ